MVVTCNYLCLVLATTALLITGSQGQCNNSTKKIDVRKLGAHITSPGYFERRPYPHNSHCRWLVEAMDGDAVVLYVSVVDLNGSNSSNCTSDDRVLIYNGVGSSFSPPLSRLCRQSDQGRHFYSTGRFLFVEFFSDDSIGGTRFNLHMQSVDRYPETTSVTMMITTTERTLDDSSGTGGSSSFNWVFLMLAVAGAFGFSCLLALCRATIKRGCTAPNHASNAPNPAQCTMNPAHFAQNHAPSSDPAHQQVENGLLQQNGGGNNTQFSRGDNMSSAANSGHVNTEYSNFGEAPPPYEVVVDSGNGSGQRETLPSYSEAIKMSDI